MRLAQPRTSLRSSVSTAIPARSRSFSLYRTVLKAVGRAPIAPMRVVRRPRTTRQIARKRARSARNSAESGATVWREVRLNRIPYWRRLLQTDILPQNESRRSASVMRLASSGKAWTSTGTSRPEKRIALATAFSSPKLGRVTRIPSMRSACSLKISAQARASWRLSTEPNCRASAGKATTSNPASASTASIASRPAWQRCVGKKPRLPTMSPRVVRFMARV